MSVFVKILTFLGALAPVLGKVYDHVESGEDDPEKEHELALDVIREAKRAKARSLGLL